jgi:hypothetical protein
MARASITLTTTRSDDALASGNRQKEENDTMADVKMGTQYVREVAEVFRKAAPDCKHAGIKEKLLSLAEEMETLAGKLYFKTQKGTEDMVALSAKVEGLSGKLAGDEASAQAFCGPIFDEISKLLEMVKTMKVRMT